MQALDAQPGDRVLEVGCGHGLLLQQVANAVGGTGLAHGVDLSADQVDAASRLCADLPQVQVSTGDVVDLDLDDASFDSTVSTQVLEYVGDVDTALEELARVTSPGGRFVNVATNWSALFWAGGDEALTERILAAWDLHCPHPNLPVALPNLLQRAGFEGVEQTPVTIVNRRFVPELFGWGVSRLMVAFAEGSGAIDAAEGAAWISSLGEADIQDRHFLSSVPILTVATRGISSRFRY